MRYFHTFMSRRWALLVTLALCFIASMALGVAWVQAAGTTRYVNPNGTCNAQAPCYTSIALAINASANGDTIVVQADITENDLQGSPAVANLTIEGYSSTSLITLTGALYYQSINNWTVQNMKMTGSVVILTVPNGVTLNNIDFIQANSSSVDFGSIGGTAGTVVISNNSFPGGNSTISIAGPVGAPLNGSITISNNSVVYAVNVFSYVTTSGQGDFNANLVLDHNTIINSANLGVSNSGSNSGVGNITGTITVTNNTTTGADSGLGVTVNGLATHVTGTISGTMTFTGNVTDKIAVLTSDSPGPSNVTGIINVTGNDCERIELGFHGFYSGSSVSVQNNKVTYKGSPEGTFIAVDAYNFANTATINVSGNTGNTQMTVISRQGTNDAPTTIANNQASHILYQVQTTNGAPFTISGNTVAPASGVPGYADGFLVIQTGNNGGIVYGFIQNNTLANFQGSINGPLYGTLSMTGNWISGQANLHINTLGNTGSQIWTGNHLKDFYTDTNSTVHFNTILGKVNYSNATVRLEDNWWGCNTCNGGFSVPHLVLAMGLTCTSPTNLGVAFNLANDSNGAITIGNTVPAIVGTTSTVGAVNAPSSGLRNAAGSTTITLPAGGGSPTVNVMVDSQTLTQSQTCNSASASPDAIGIFRNGTFYLRNANTTGTADITVAFNPAVTAYPIVGDWTGAGIDTVGVYDQTNGLFSLCTANDTANCASPANVKQIVLGNPGDQPIAGHWSLATNHDGVGVFRPSNGLIYLRSTLTTGYADYTMVLGIPGDSGLSGDWNGDGIDSPGVYRSSTISFFVSDQVTNGPVFGDAALQYGVSGDSPVAGDWIAQGHDGIGLFRPTNGYTYLRNTLTTGYADITFVYGIAGDIPIAGHWSSATALIRPLNLIVAQTPVPVAATAAPITPNRTPLPGGFDG